MGIARKKIGEAAAAAVEEGAGQGESEKEKEKGKGKEKSKEKGKEKGKKGEEGDEVSFEGAFRLSLPYLPLVLDGNRALSRAEVVVLRTCER
jgi:hypothetical protein